MHGETVKYEKMKFHSLSACVRRLVARQMFVAFQLILLSSKWVNVGGGMIPNADDFLSDYTASHPRKRQFSQSPRSSLRCQCNVVLCVSVGTGLRQRLLHDTSASDPRNWWPHRQLYFWIPAR